MSTALIIAGIAVLVVSSGTTIFIAVQFSRTLSRAFFLTESVHERSVKHQESLLDRIMSVDYASFQAWRSAETEDEGGFVVPQEPEADGVRTITPGWGSVSPVRVRFASEVDGDENPTRDEQPEEMAQGVPTR